MDKVVEFLKWFLERVLSWKRVSDQDVCDIFPSRTIGWFLSSHKSSRMFYQIKKCTFNIESVRKQLKTDISVIASGIIVSRIVLTHFIMFSLKATCWRNLKIEINSILTFPHHHLTISLKQTDYPVSQLDICK